MFSRLPSLIVVVGVLVCGKAAGLHAAEAADPQAAKAAEEAFLALGDEYQSQILPLSKQFCLDCHGAETREGELDLERFAALADVRQGAKTWEKVADMLDNGEMPPEEAEQPTPDQRRQLREWVRRYLKAEALASAGDPGPVVLRRLSNVEYSNTIRELTGVDLDPAREFPVDGAAGEGFTNAGEALVMSPALLDKYLTAAKGIAAHAVLLPDGMRFSPATAARDWTDERLTEIRRIYSQFSDPEGRVPLDAYLATTIEHREAIAAGTKSLAALAAERGLSPKYLQSLWQVLHDGQPSCLLDDFRRRWRAAQPGDVPGLVADIRQWQQALTKFNSVGYFKPWQEPASPLRSSQDFRLKFEPPPEADQVLLYLSATDAGDGAEGDVVVWQRPRLEMAGCATLLLRDVPELIQTRRRTLAAAAKYLTAAAEALDRGAAADVAALARQHGVEPGVLMAWLGYLGIASAGPVPIDGYLTGAINNVGGYDFIRGWGTLETPSLLANSSDREVRIPGLMKPHSVAVHPSPTVQAVVGWRSPMEGIVRLEANVADAHPECGNGIAWALDQRRGTARQRLAAGTIDTGGNANIGPIEKLAVAPGDVICLLIGPRGDHSCDLTRVDITISTAGIEPAKWNLTDDAAGDVRAGNPHADRQGHLDVWHFYTEPVSEDAGTTVTAFAVPADSLLDRWRKAKPAEKVQLADEVQRLLTDGPPPQAEHPDAVLSRQLISLSGPLFARIDLAARETRAAAAEQEPWGLDPALFGKGPNEQPLDAASLGVQAPSILEIRLPVDLLAGREFVVDGELADAPGAGGSVQLRVGTAKPNPAQRLLSDLPIVVRDGSPARQRIEAGLDEFRRWFSAAVCFTQIVPIDEVVTVEEFHRDDEPLCRLLLDEGQHAQLERLWDELRYVSQDALTVEESYGQFMEYTTQDRNPADYEHMRKPIGERAAAFRTLLLDTEPRQIESLLDFASRAFRRPLAPSEADQLRALYQGLRAKELPHDEAFRAVLARVLIAPEFLYRIEQPGPGTEPQRVSDWELASRLSYFLWASPPDDELRRLAGEGKLADPEVLAAESRRMLRDARARGLATEFACQWIGVRDFQQLDEKSERHFPTFAGLRDAMYEESVRFFVDLFERDGSLLELLDADHTFVNEELARHYGIPGVSGPQWRRVDGVKALGRGGILALATTLSKQSGASRTSPILRGNWVVETLLGEKLPKPPKGVPLLPEDETATEGLTVRQLVEKHRSVASCAKCHDRIDPFGFALEGYDAIGRRREKDLADRPIDTNVTLMDGSQFQGLEGLRDYLLTQRRDQFLRNFCRKLTGYALGRAVQLSDEPLLDEMVSSLRGHDYRFSAAAETIVRSRQFRFHRGLAEPEASQSLTQ